MNESQVNLLDIINDLENIHYPSGIQFQRLQRCKLLHNNRNEELTAIYNLVESHSPGLRNKASLRYEKFLSSDAAHVSNVSLTSVKEDIALKCHTKKVDKNITSMLKQVEEMPKEWTLVHLTPQFSPLQNIAEDNDIYQTNPLYIAVFNCGQSKQKPFLVTVDAPKDSVNGNCIQLAQEMMSIIKGNKEALMSHKEKYFKNQQVKNTYINRRQSIEDRLKGIIKDIQDMWLKEWRCLLSGKYIDASLEDKIKMELTIFFKIEFGEMYVTTRTISLLTYVVKATKHLKLLEVMRAVQYCFPQMEDKNSLKKIVHFIRNLGDTFIKGADTKKHPVILILDDALDCFPWEMIDVLNNEPVSRVPSLHFIYLLFKEHEKDIVDGHKIVSDFEKGTYIVNPDTDLKNMEVRMTNFFNYWTPNWTGISGYRPQSSEFFELLTSAEIFSYNGHGSGSHLLAMDQIQRTHVKAVVLLFGCGSTKINRLDCQVEMYSTYYMYLIARCPCMVGMLWEVTDLDTDILTTGFMSHWIPSKAPVHWKYVDKTKWTKAEEDIKFEKAGKSTTDEVHNEPELLRALSLSKKLVSYYGTKAACVARGLPIKIVEKPVL